MGRVAGCYTALSTMNPAEPEAEVHPLQSRANSVLLCWIYFDAKLSFEGTISCWSFLFASSALPSLNQGCAFTAALGSLTATSAHFMVSLA